MKTVILGLRTTIYKVSDIKKAKEWYSKVFLTEPYFDEPFYVGYNISGYELGLQPGENSGEKKGGGVVSYWGVENIKAEFGRFIESGALEHEAPQNVGGDILVASVRDPWDNVIGLIYNPHFKLPVK
jgi:predicted enzyme related to lactoylglutathione lyase